MPGTQGMYANYDFFQSCENHDNLVVKDYFYNFSNECYCYHGDLYFQSNPIHFEIKENPSHFTPLFGDTYFEYDEVIRDVISYDNSWDKRFNEYLSLIGPKGADHKIILAYVAYGICRCYECAFGIKDQSSCGWYAIYIVSIHGLVPTLFNLSVVMSFQRDLVWDDNNDNHYYISINKSYPTSGESWRQHSVDFLNIALNFKPYLVYLNSVRLPRSQKLIVLPFLKLFFSLASTSMYS